MTNIKFATNETTNLAMLRDEDHIPSSIVSIVLSVATAYLLLAIIVYLIQIIKKKKIHSSTSTQEKKYGFLSLIVCLLVTIFSLIRNLTSAGGFLFLESLSKLNYTSEESKQKLMADIQLSCDIGVGTGNISFTLGTGFVYLFLWLRQRIFYIHPVFCSLRNKCISVSSFVLIIVWFFYDVFTSVTYFAFVRFKFNEKVKSCVLSSEMSITWFLGIIISWATTSILMQLILLALFIYPLLRQNSWRRKNNVNDTALLNRVKKAVLLTTCSLITDIAALILTLIFDSAVTVVFYNINLFVNNIIIVGCFDQWKTIIWPFKKNLVNNSSHKNFHSTIKAQTVGSHSLKI